MKHFYIIFDEDLEMYRVIDQNYQSYGTRVHFHQAEVLAEHLELEERSKTLDQLAQEGQRLRFY